MQNQDFRTQQQKILKDIIKQIKNHYLNFLSSLKFENTPDKKHEKDYMNPAKMEEENDLQAPPNAMQLNSIMKSELNFQDEIFEENKGYTSFIQLLNQIKKLKNFNSSLCIMLMEAAPYEGENSKRTHPK